MAEEESYPKLISLAVHELRTPVGVVSGYLRMLALDKESPLSERQRRMVDEANKSCTRLVALLAELSEVSKLDDGTLAIVPRALDLFPLIADVASGTQEPEDRGVRVEVVGRAEGATIRGDVDRLRTAFGAIFAAIVREKPGPAVVQVDRRIIGTGTERSAVVIVAERADAQAAYEAATTPFDEKRGGVGLSLPLARRVIEAHGGRLWSPALPDRRAAKSIALVSLPLQT